MTIDLKRLTNLAETAKERAQKAADGRNNGRWYRMTNLGPTTAEIYVYDYIGTFGVEAGAFVAELNSLNVQDIELHIASEGGEVWDGLTIYAALRNHPARITSVIDSLAASAASFIAMAADPYDEETGMGGVRMERTARMMIHEANGGVVGRAKDMRDVADVLDDMSDNIASIYAEKTGTDAKLWRKKMADETWFTAEKALAAGLVDQIIGASKATNEVSATITNVNNTDPVFVWDADMFRSAVKEAIA